MKNKLLYLAAFSIGATVGSVVTWYAVKKKEEQRADDEINSMKEYHAKQIKHYKEDLAAAQEYIDNEIDHVPAQEASIFGPEKEVEEIEEEIAKGERTDYTKFHNIRPVTEEPKVIDPEEPYLLDSADEYGDDEDFDTEVLYFTADEILTDMDGHIIEDVASMVGVEALGMFGDEALECFGDEDSVYVRNERLGCDYEILRSPDTYDVLFSDD